MADIKKPTIGNSVNYTIGGKKYSANEVSHLQPSQTGNAKTASDISRQSVHSVQNQTTDYYKSGSDISKSGIQSEVSSVPKSVDTIKTGTESEQPKPEMAQYKTQVTTAHTPTPHKSAPQTIPSSVSSSGTGGMKTESAINRESTQKVQSQTADYYKTGAYEPSKAGIQSEAQRTPRTVEAVRTGAGHTPEQSGSTYGRQQTGTGYVPQAGNTTRILTSSPYVSTGNVKTQSVISSEAAHKVQSQTTDYNKTNAYNASQTVIRDRVDKSPVNVAGIQTGNVHIPKGTSFSFFNAIDNTRNKPINLGSAVTQVAGKTQSALSGQDDLGTQAAGTGVGAGIVGVQAFRTTQKVTEAAPVVAKETAKGLYKIGKGVYQVGLTGALAVVAVSRTAAFVQAGQFHAISHASLQMLKAQAVSTGLSQTALSQRIIHSVKGIQTKIKMGIQSATHIGNQIKTGYSALKNAGIRIVRGVAAGTITVAVARKTIEKYANKAIKAGIAGVKTGVKAGIKTAGKGIVKGVTKSASFVTFKALPGTGRFMLHSGIPSVAGILKGADDYAVQGVGHALTAADITVQTAVKGIKATPYVVKTAVKAGKGIYGAGKGTVAAAKFIKNNGLRAAWNAGRKKAAQAAAKAGQSIVTALINGIKALGSKVIVPLIVVIAVVMAASGVITIPITAVSSMFSSTFSTSDTNTDYDVRDYLSTILSTLSAEFQQNLADQMSNSLTDSLNSYHIVRFYSNTGSDEALDSTLSGIASIFPNNEELLNMIQPIFNAVILMEYELEPTEAEAKTLTEELFEKLFTVTTTPSTEYCGQDLLTGAGTVTLHECGSVHKLDDCPNPVTGNHTSNTCSSCCYYSCPGHEWFHEDSETCEGHTSYCTGCVFNCSGYSYCGGHDVITYTLSLDGIYALEAEYFLTPIEQLSNIANRTEQQEAQLQELKDYYEIFIEMMSQVSINYGGGLTISDLSGVVFINGTRTANQDVINLALSQVGQTGGQPYWSYYGFSSRVEWCACFVHWCMRHTSSASSAYPTTSNNAYCQTVANNFVSIGQWGDRSYTDLVAGDTIFFDWQGDGHTDHIGLVIGTDGTSVYTVEGNSGDAVKIKSYPLGSSVIYGYGLMNY